MNYITLTMALEKHEYIIQVSGGLHGIVPDNQQHLESLLLLYKMMFIIQVLLKN